MDLQIFSDLFQIGLHPMPLVWDAVKKEAVRYPEHVTDVRSGNGHHDLDDVRRWLSDMSNANAIALKLHPPFFMFDFDVKNTSNKNIYHTWLNAVNNACEDGLKKMVIERTRSGGVSCVW